MIHQPCGLQIVRHRLAARKTIHAVELRAVLPYLRLDGFQIDVGVRREYIISDQVMLLPEHIVIYVVRRCHLQATRTESDLYVAVFDDRYLSANDRYAHMLAAQPLVLLFLGVDADGYVAEDRLGTRGGHNGILAGLFHYLVLQVVELRVLVVVDYLLVAQGCLTLRIPVHHPQTPVYQPLPI